MCRDEAGYRNFPRRTGAIHQGGTGMTYAKGMRVRLSEEGRRVLGRRQPDREGTVAATPHYAGFVSVHWDGLSERTVYRYADAFIEAIDTQPRPPPR